MLPEWTASFMSRNGDDQESAMRRIAKNLDDDILDYDYIQVPYVRDSHWVLGTIIHRKQQILYWDSYGHDDAHRFCYSLAFILNFKKESQNKDSWYDDWITINIIKNPQQFDGCNCAIFMLEYALTVIDIENDDITSIQQKVEGLTHQISRIRTHQLAEMLEMRTFIYSNTKRMIKRKQREAQHLKMKEDNSEKVVEIKE